MKKFFLKVGCFVLSLFTLALISCDKGEVKEANLYESGIEIALVMEEMAKSETYSDFMGAHNYDFTNVLAEDYRAPASVYSISVPTYEEMIACILAQEESAGWDVTDEKEMWDSLSDTLKEQLGKRYGFSTIVTQIIARNAGNQQLATAQMYQAYLTGEGKLEDSLAYLYAYETGTPIVVTFTPGCCNSFSISGQFLFGVDGASVEKVREAFTPFGCQVEKIR